MQPLKIVYKNIIWSKTKQNTIYSIKRFIPGMVKKDEDLPVDIGMGHGRCLKAPYSGGSPRNSEGNVLA